MASSYSTDLKLELMVTGENAGTWGDKTNTNLNLVQQAIAGVESIALTDGGTVTLVMSDAAISNARNMVLKLTGTLTTASELHIPDSIEKFYIIDASSVTGPTNLTVETVSGTGFTLDQSKIYACYSDGTNITEVSLDTLGGSIGTAGITDAAVTTAKISDNAITAAKISDNQITTAKISDNQITTAKISDNQITTAKISDNQVTAAKLDDVFGGTPGEFETATITVDAQGRITAASAGSAGSKGTKLSVLQAGPASGSFSRTNCTRIYAMMAGGGGGGGTHPSHTGGVGGDGAFGIFQADSPSPIGGDFNALPYQVGSGGGLNAAGNPSFIGNFVTNAGNGGSGPGNGNPGSTSPAPLFLAQPGSTQATQFRTAHLADFGGGGNPNGPGPTGANPGTPGVIMFYDNGD